MQQAHNDIEQRGGEMTEEEAEKMMNTGLSAIWKMGKFEVCLWLCFGREFRCSF